MRINDPKGMACPYRMRKCPGESCPLYVQILGTDSNSGDTLNQGACAQAASVAFLMQIVQDLNGLQKATESQRNETVQGLFHLGQTISAASRERAKLLAAG
jgi:hypothetical protein